MVGSKSVETAVRVEDESRAGEAAGIGGYSLTLTDGNSEISADAGRRAEARGPYSSLRLYSLIPSSEELTATLLVSSVETPQVWGKNHEYLQLTQDGLIQHGKVTISHLVLSQLSQILFGQTLLKCLG